MKYEKREKQIAKKTDSLFFAPKKKQDKDKDKDKDYDYDVFFYKRKNKKEKPQGVFYYPPTNQKRNFDFFRKNADMRLEKQAGYGVE